MVKGAPANPKIGTSAAAVASRMDSMGAGRSRTGSKSRSAATSAAVRTGFRITGPVPGMYSSSAPMLSRGSKMSEKIMPASNGYRRSGCRVTSVASSGVWHIVRNECWLRSARYSGRYRPACRMNHTGGRSRVSLRSARTMRGRSSFMVEPA